MNGKYFGGGMKLSPNSDRGDNVLELFVIHTLGFWKLLCVFPLIFLGKHLWFKYLGISILKGREFIFEANAPQVLQSDGEVLNGIKNFIINIYWSNISSYSNYLFSYIHVNCSCNNVSY